jgi:hypothetical protein
MRVWGVLRRGETLVKGLIINAFDLSIVYFVSGHHATHQPFNTSSQYLHLALFCRGYLVVGVGARQSSTGPKLVVNIYIWHCSVALTHERCRHNVIVKVCVYLDMMHNHPIVNVSSRSRSRSRSRIVY